MAPQDVLDEFFRYVQNEIPIRLIYVKEMRLVDRYFVQQHYLRSIGLEIGEHINNQRLRYGRKAVIRGLVPEIVKYDILSHRWLPQGEPTVKDMMDDTVKDMMDSTAVKTPGYVKLENFCRAARSDFVWSDTCCIDKSSSSELDESIRSMFKWYRNSTVCIVHLAQTTQLADMGKDEWFERGWTLQELLAPRVIKFHDANWQPFIPHHYEGDNYYEEGHNNKTVNAVLDLLVSATGCSKGKLKYFEPGPFKVDQRMSWAAKRKATRAEDMAYSLMGIFDVIIQPAYGEGGERAFCRLVEAIMLSSGDSSVLNWAGKEASIHNSKAMPSSPRRYLGHPSVESTDNKLDMAMTSRGLRIPLVILPLELKGPRSIGSLVSDVAFSFSDLSRVDSDDIHVEVLEMSDMLEDYDWALGLFNYLPPSSKYTGHPALQRRSAGYLLRRPRIPGVQGDDTGEGQILNEGLTSVWECGAHDWKKGSTTKSIHVFFKSIPEFRSMVVDKKRLEVVYL